MNNYKTIVLLVILFGAIGWFFWPAPTPHYPTAGTNIVIFGDSLAAGVGAGPNETIGDKLATALGRPVINLGVSGDTTADGLARIDTLLATDPQVVIILLGGNDALRQIPVETTFQNLLSIIEQVQAAGAAVILVGEPGGLFGSNYEKEYERLAEEYRTFYVPNILSGLIGRSEYMSDAIHPNSAGYALAADRILPEVQKALLGD